MNTRVMGALALTSLIALPSRPRAMNPFAPWFVVPLLIATASVGAETFDQYSVRQVGATTVHRIDRPNVKRAATRYDRIRVSPGDRVAVSAGGCAQTGGHGKTWKRYVDPQGPNSEDYYSGMIDIPGVTDEPRRLEGVVGQTHIATAGGIVSLGYQDDNFDDNGYGGHDDGTGNQCRGVGPAWVEIHVTRGAPIPVSSPRYNRVYQKSVHNAYELGDDKNPLERQLGEFRIRSIEIDIHDSKALGLDQPPRGDFYVYHADVAPLNGTQCRLLSDCLARIARWHRSRPHDPLTIFVDVKDDWGRRSPADLDAQLRRAFGANVFTPGDLMRACRGARSLQDAVRGACAWPRIAEMRNKVLFALTGEEGTLRSYAARGLASNVAFIAPEIGNSSKMQEWTSAVFFNLNSDHFGTGRDAYRAGFVSRVFYKWSKDVHGINDYKNWRPAVNRFIHHIATDKVDPRKHPWTVTYNRNGFPYRCMEQDCASLQETR